MTDTQNEYSKTVPCWQTIGVLLVLFANKVPAKILARIKEGAITKRLWGINLNERKQLAIKLIRREFRITESVNFVFIDATSLNLSIEQRDYRVNHLITLLHTAVKKD